MQNLTMSLLWYFVAYFIVTLIGVLHTIFNIKVRHMKSMKDGPGMGEGYEKTKPWHPLYNLVIFPIFAYVYLSGIPRVMCDPDPYMDSCVIIQIFPTVVMTSIFWGSLTIVIDLLGWVIIKHPWSLSFREFYIEYQPWITLIYITIFASPFIAYGIMELF